MTVSTFLHAIDGERASDKRIIRIFHVPSRGWASVALGFHDGVGPYFSLLDAIRRAELEMGAECIWQPSIVKQTIDYPEQPTV
jgi:hypothetical protein